MASAAEQLAANMNFGAFRRATELHKRIWFTLSILIVYRIGTFIPLPGVDVGAMRAQFAPGGGAAGGLLQMYNMFSGGAVANMAIFALNVMPYISASIIVQLLGSVYPPWEKLKKEGGEAGRKTLNQYTRYLTVFLAVFQSLGIAVSLSNSEGLVYQPGPFFIVAAVTILTGGTMFLMWLGEQITSRGIGNGISLLIFSGIVAQMPIQFAQLFAQAREGAVSTAMLMIVLMILVAIVFAIVFFERSQRRVLIQYPKQQRGNRVFGGDKQYLPMKINPAGVIPPIFASSLLLLPTTVLGFLATAELPRWAEPLQGMSNSMAPGTVTHMIFYASLIVFFTFFYTSIVFNPEDTAENLRKYGGFIPGIRPGKRTQEYLHYVLIRLTTIGAAYIAIVCLLPEFAMSFNPALQGIAYGIGGTSILIVVSVTMDTVSQIQSHLLAHQYEGLIRKSRLRGGRK